MVACGGRSTDSDASPPETGGATSAGAASASAGAASGGAGNPRPPMPQPIAGTGGQTSGTAGETASAGEGSIDGCPGIVRSCTPGESLCDPALGVTATCDECGVVRPDQDGQLCARLIASDKESNYVCIVRGATELQCLPPSGLVERGVVPAETREIFIRDDAASNGGAAVCEEVSVAAHSCFPTCSKVSLGDGGGCAICSGALNCKGNVILPAIHADPVIDIAVTDGSLFSLGADGVRVNDLSPRLPDFWQGAPRQMGVDHQWGGCVISTLDEMACWESLGQPFVPSAWKGFRKWLPMTLPRACMVDTEGRAGCGDVFVGTGPPLFDGPNVVDLVASASLACALTREGRVLCWNAQGAALELPTDW